MGHAPESVFALPPSAAAMESHHRRQEHGVERARCRRGFINAKTVSNYARSPDLLKCHVSLHAGAHQLAACFASLRVARSIWAQPRVAIEGNTVGRWAKAAASEGFHAVRDCVHAGRSR